MEVEVKHNRQYREVFFEDSTCKVGTGLLDKDERTELAGKLIEAAYDLLPEDDYGFQQELLALITQNL